MRVTQHIQKWGNGTGIRLPKKLLDEANLRPGQSVRIDLSGASIVLTPVKDDTDRLPNLAELLRGVSPEKVGGEYHWRADQGYEKVDD